LGGVARGPAEPGVAGGGVTEGLGDTTGSSGGGVGRGGSEGPSGSLRVGS
jgi:hypothetical protein